MYLFYEIIHILIIIDIYLKSKYVFSKEVFSVVMIVLFSILQLS